MKIKKKKNNNVLQLFKKVLILFLVIILAFYIGIKILINILFLSSKFFPNKSQNFIPTPPLEAKPLLTPLSIPEATNSAHIKTTLYAENVEKIEIFVNDMLTKIITPEDNNIEIEVDNLKEGKNIIYFVGYFGKKAEKTKEFSIKVDTIPPELELFTPQNTQTSEEQIEIKGKTEPNVTVRINSLPVIVASDGSFSTYVFLKEGENKIKIDATDEAGNTTIKELLVSRNT